MDAFKKLEKNLLEGYSLIVIKDDKEIFKSKDHGIKALFQLLDKDKDILKHTIVLDKRVGRAAALLLIKGDIKKLITLKLSKSAKQSLKENNILFEAQEIVDNIMSKDGSKICRLEELSQDREANDFFEILKIKKIFE
ncbi:MAG: DUF1893 domain-containing protein [Patescibacteria group bacterium]